MSHKALSGHLVCLFVCLFFTLHIICLCIMLSNFVFLCLPLCVSVFIRFWCFSLFFCLFRFLFVLFMFFLILFYYIFSFFYLGAWFLFVCFCFSNDREHKKDVNLWRWVDLGGVGRGRTIIRVCCVKKCF